MLQNPESDSFLAFFGLVDLIAILPFYLAFGMDLKSLRAIRLFRILRLFKFLRYGNTMEKMKKSFNIIKRELFIFTLATLMLIYFSSIGIYYFENEAQPEVFTSLFDAMWWSVATLTTVGYGDVYPITNGGKIFASVIVFIGLGLVAIPTGLIASSLTKSFSRIRHGMLEELASLKINALRERLVDSNARSVFVNAHPKKSRVKLDLHSLSKLCLNLQNQSFMHPFPIQSLF